MLENARKASKLLSREHIFEQINSLAIFEKYLNISIKRLPTTIKSPFRSDKRPSFCIYGRNQDNLRFQDKATQQQGGAIDFVMLLFSLNFYEALVKINEDFDLKLAYLKGNYDIQKTHETVVIPKVLTQPDKKITIKLNKDYQGNHIFSEKDIDYWSQFEITPEYLNKHNVKSVQHVFINDELFISSSEDNPIYAYVYFYNNEVYYKIYRPFSKSFKFFNDFRGITRELLHGGRLIPKDGGDKLIITKSVKDNMVLDACGFNSISVQSEGTHILKKHMDWLRKKWNSIYLLYDNDWNKSENWGQKHADKIILKYPYIKNIKIPSIHKSTDPADLIKKYKMRYTRNIINKLLT